MSDFIPLTFNYTTAVTYHKVLEQIVVIQCSLAKWSDYGLAMIDKSLLRVANTEDTEFLVQAELNAIKQGLQFKQIEYDNGAKYYGYVNQQGQREGVGIREFPDGY